MSKKPPISIRTTFLILVSLLMMPLAGLFLAVGDDRFGWIVLGALVLTVAVLCVAVARLLGNRFLLSPVERLALSVRALAGGGTVDPVDEALYPIELKGLVRAFNGLSAKLREREASRSLVEAALREREARLRSLVRTAPVGVGVAINDALMEVNEQICRMTGYSQTELVGSKTRVFYASGAEHRFAGIEEYRQIRSQGNASIETCWRTKGGRTLEVLLNATPIDVDNWAAGVMFVALDITEKKRAEQALMASNERFMTVLESIDANIYVADMDSYEVLFMNKTMIRDFGDDLTGRTCWKAFRDEQGPCGCCTNDRLVDDEGNPTGLCVWESPNPVTGKWYLNYDRAIRWVDDRLVRLQISTDITQIKELEGERRRIEEQMRHSSKMEAIGTLAGGIAHDFNNILGIIIGNAELGIEDAEPSSRVGVNLEEIRTAGLRARDVVAQLTSFSRKDERRRVPMDLAPIVRESLKLMRASIPASIDIVDDIDNDTGSVMADAAQVHQVLINLCTNAAHAMSRGGGLLAVKLKRVHLTDEKAEEAGMEIGGAFVKLTVTDNGKGIAGENLERIFDPYFTTKGVGKGTGMGLAVVHGIVSGHDGVVRVFSRLEEGSRFEILLPVMLHDGRVPADALAALARGKGERILFVDDEQAMAAMGRTILERLGYQVEALTSPVEALERVRSHPRRYDLLLTDMTMPGMTGDRLTAAVRTISPDMPVILCTGYSETINNDRARELGIDGYIEKPVDRRLLAETVRRLLDTRLNRG